VAQRKTKAQKQASLRAKERAARRTKETTRLDQWAIALHEVAQSMRRAGFSEGHISGFIYEQRLPEWVHPDHFDPFQNDDEEEDDY
jgi:hypothetical protein